MSSREKKKASPSDRRNSTKPVLAEVSSMLRSLPGLSIEDWTSERKKLWDYFVELCRESELEAIKSEGTSAREAEKLIKRSWVIQCPDSGHAIPVNLPSGDPTSSVPVIQVFRNGAFQVAERIFDHLPYHPLLSGAVFEFPSQDEQKYVRDILDEVAAMNEELGFDGFELSHSVDLIPDHAGAEYRVAKCSNAADHLWCLLNPENRHNGEDENLDWLPPAKAGRQFWKLLKAAISLGKAMERYRILDVQNLERVAQQAIITPPGKKTGEFGKAIERMIEEYTLAKGAPPAPQSLFRWLGAERPFNDGDPLEVDHVLWPKTMPKFTWPQFQQLVKDAKKRMKR